MKIFKIVLIVFYNRLYLIYVFKNNNKYSMINIKLLFQIYSLIIKKNIDFDISVN